MKSREALCLREVLGTRVMLKSHRDLFRQEVVFTGAELESREILLRQEVLLARAKLYREQEAVLEKRGGGLLVRKGNVEEAPEEIER